ncbi:MAG: protein-L-isoaspartate(D-aspartate) O-methyltransferase [Deltaproteobacteria bacterium]|nr:protein-L-isoaspartate(D-aspartate) O-methyltransferase [Deltaproteobacteria bacterium]
MRGVFSRALVIVALLSSPAASGEPAGKKDASAAARSSMVRSQIEERGIDDPRVLVAMREVPRHRFVPPAYRAEAHADHPLPIGHGQTISQPYIVALMSQAAGIEPGDRVLEVGTGSGYQAAVLARMGAEVYSIEILEALAKEADARLKALGYPVTVRHGDGYAGWPEKAPFDAIVVTAAPPQVPEPLKAQLKVGGRLVIPVGEHFQSLRVITRTPEGFTSRSIAPVRFVPMTGEAQRRR